MSCLVVLVKRVIGRRKVVGFGFGVWGIFFMDFCGRDDGDIVSDVF